MTLDNDLLTKWLEAKQLTDFTIKDMVETIQKQRDEIRGLRIEVNELAEELSTERFTNECNNGL